MYPVLLKIGTFELRSYGVVVALAFLLGLWLSTREAKRNGFDSGLVQDFAFYAFLGGIIGARIYFVGFSNPAHYLKNPWEIVAIWHGGMSIIGALLGGSVTALWYCRRHQLSFWRFADTLAPGVALGQAVGIFACLLNGDSYGKPTTLAWAIKYSDPRAMAPLNVPLHPVEIYEMAAYLLVFLIVWLGREKRRPDGFTFLTYLAGYGAARFAVEFFRGDPAIFGWGIPAAQVFGVLLVLASIVGFYIVGEARRKPR